MNRRGLFGLVGASLVASCLPQAAVADAPRPRLTQPVEKAWYVERLREAVLEGQEVCTHTSGPLHDACASTLKINEDTTRLTRPHGFIYWTVPRGAGARIIVADLLVGAAWRDPSFVPTRHPSARQTPKVLRA